MAHPTPTQLPPQNKEAEVCLLGSLMIDVNAIVRVADFLLIEDFYYPEHQKIYQAMLDLFQHNTPIDVLSVSNTLKEKGQLNDIGGQAYLSELVSSVPTASNAANYASIVQKKRVLRDLISASHEIEAIARNEAEDSDVLLDRAERHIFSIAQKSFTQRFHPLREGLENTFERIDQLSKYKGGLRGLPSGFTKLDNTLAGLQKSDLIILAARPSMGKSALALDIARNVAVFNKTPVGIFSLEMSQDQIIDRMLAGQANVDLWKLRTGRLSEKGDQNDFSRIQAALGILSEAPIFIDDTSGINILQMRAMARRLQANYGLGLLIIDYLQLMNPMNSMHSMVQQVTENSRALKGLAKELNIPVLVLSQLSRAVEQRTPHRPRLSDLRESGCLTGDTLITNAKTGERITIKDIAEGKQKPFPVWAVDDNYKVKPHQMIKAFYSGKKEVFELRTRSGRTIKASANHPFLQIDGWKPLEKLNAGDFIALPRHATHTNPTSIDNRELILLAHLLGDGCILPKQHYHYTSADKQNIQTVKDSAWQLFNIKGRVVQQKNWYHLYLPSPDPLARGKIHPITSWFNKLGIKRVRSYQKRVPDSVFSCSFDQVALFLKHLWSTDGNISHKMIPGRKPSASIYYSSTSLKLAQDVQHLLLKLGILSTIRAVDQKKHRLIYQIHVLGAPAQLRFLNIVGCAGERGKIIPEVIANLKKIYPNPNVDVVPALAWDTIIKPAKEEIGISWREFSRRIQTQYCGTALFAPSVGRLRLLRVSEALEDNQNIKNLATSDIFWDQIVSVTPKGIEDVYDATIEDVHNFVANDIIVHNSIEQDADVVMFIYREDFYKENPSQENVADIIIAKHRNGPVGQISLYFDGPRVTFRNLEESSFDKQDAF